MQTLTCKAGHDWTRPAQRGAPPRYCPDHAPQRTAPLTPDELSARRAAKAEADEAARREHWAWYRKWSRSEAALTARILEAERVGEASQSLRDDRTLMWWELNERGLPAGKDPERGPVEGAIPA